MNQSDRHEVVLEVRNLTKYFPVGTLLDKRQVHALEDVSFTIRRGRVLALVGESGSGKSTVARLIARLMPPTSGKIIFKSENVVKSEPQQASLEYRSQVQMVFQDPFGSLNPVRRVGYHLERPLLIHKKVKNRSELESRIDELLDTVGLSPARDFADKYPHQLSGGQRQRVAIARALAVDPEIMLADEPISMLDVSIRMGVLNLMTRLKEERGIGYLYITHDIASARYIGDEIMVLYAGRLVEGGDSEELMSQPAHPYTRLLLSAVPSPESGLSTRTLQARGEVPSLVDPPPGCPFAPRCPHVMPICREMMPGVEHVAQNHWVRCHLYGAGEAGQPGASIRSEQSSAALAGSQQLQTESERAIRPSAIANAEKEAVTGGRRSGRLLFIPALLAGGLALAVLSNLNIAAPAQPTESQAVGVTIPAAAAATLHYTDPDHRVADLHPFYKDGQWYLFHLFPTPTGGIDNGLVVSNDLLHWRKVDIRHDPGGPRAERWWAVGVFYDRERNVYRSYFDAGDASAVSADLLGWRRAESSYDIRRQPLYSSQRDPWTFYNDDPTEQSYWTIMTVKVAAEHDPQKNGAIAFASSPDLQSWTPRGNLYYPRDIPEPEVPQMFRIGGKWYLLFSILNEGGNGRVGRPSYVVADKPTGPWRKAGSGVLDSSDLAAANVGFDGKRLLLLGWVPLHDKESYGEYSWGGHVALPRELYQLPDGETLGTRLETSVGAKIRGEQIASAPAAVSGDWRLDTMAHFTGGGYGRLALPNTSERLDIELTVDFMADSKRAGLLFNHDTAATPSGIEVAVDNEHSRLVVQSGDVVYAELPIDSSSGPHRIRVIAEDDMIELFVDDRYSLAARIGTKLIAGHLQLFADGGAVDFKDIGLYKLKRLDEVS